MNDITSDDTKTVQVPRLWLIKLVELSNTISTYEDTGAAHLQGYIHSANIMFDLGVEEDE